jgi:hypothetical protein
VGKSPPAENGSKSKPAAPRSDPPIEGWHLQQHRVDGAERWRLLGVWISCNERYRELLREGYRQDDGGGSYDTLLKVAAAECDDAEAAFMDGCGVRLDGGRREIWNGTDWRDTGSAGWW